MNDTQTDKLSQLTQPGRERRELVFNPKDRKRIRGVVVATALAAAGLLAHNISRTEDADSKKAEDTAIEAVEQTNSYMEGTITLRPGVNIRRTPQTINVTQPDVEGENNVAFTLQEGEEMVLHNPVVYEDENNNKWYGFTEGFTQSGPDNRAEVYWVDSSVLYQADDQGRPYAEQAMIFEGSAKSDIDYSQSVGFQMTAIDGSQVSIAIAAPLEK